MDTINIALSKVTIASVLEFAGLLVLCVILFKLLNKLVARALKRSKLDTSLHTFIRSAVKVLLLFVILMMLGSKLGINTSSLLAVFGMFGLAVSLSVQNSLSNVVSGIMLLSTKPFAAGDYVQVAGQEGTVSEVGLLTTVLNTFDNQRIIIPNSQVSSEKIINYTGVEKRRVDLLFTASYDSAPEKVKEALTAAADHPRRLKDDELFVRTSGYRENDIEYAVRVWVRPADYWTVYFDVIEAVKTKFDENGIEMSYPHVNVHMIGNKAD